VTSATNPRAADRAQPAGGDGKQEATITPTDDDVGGKSAVNDRASEHSAPGGPANDHDALSAVASALTANRPPAGQAAAV
jgi:hypothetical protein